MSIRETYFSCIRYMPVESDEAQERLLSIHTPLVIEHGELLLASHPNVEFREYILCGLRNRFRIGSNKAVSAESARKNMLSAREHPEVVSEYLRNELERGALIGPLRKNIVQGVIFNPF